MSRSTPGETQRKGVPTRRGRLWFPDPVCAMLRQGASSPNSRALAELSKKAPPRGSVTIPAGWLGAIRAATMRERTSPRRVTRGSGRDRRFHSAIRAPPILSPTAARTQREVALAYFALAQYPTKSVSASGAESVRINPGHLTGGPRESGNGSSFSEGPRSQSNMAQSRNAVLVRPTVCPEPRPGAQVESGE